ncbi:MAG: substrate-binding domain-containing protein [Betaproteobacteria bacterium]
MHVLSAGAAKAVVTQAARDAGVALEGAFGAVGAMRDKLLAGEPCEVIVLTRSMLEALGGEGRIDPATLADLGRVQTGIAVRQGAPRPNITRADTLASALLGAESIYVPDLKQSTAGKHIAAMLESLGIAGEVAGRVREFPNGATAMRAMADAAGDFAIGCTQVSEILYTEGIALVGPLPDEFELSTLYSAAVCSAAPEPAKARDFVRFLAGEATARMRSKAGFET